MFVDLHLHTNCSDGKLNVQDTIEIAHNKGIVLLSITDHDSISGVSDAINISDLLGITCFSGLELSCRNENKGISFPDDISIHILAYNIDYKNDKLISYLKRYHRERRKILFDLIDELSTDGFEAKYDDICVIAGTQMRIQDIINHINSTFMCKEKKERFLAIANSYYKKLFAIDSPLEDAVKLIKNAGGLPVLAHAFYSYRDYDIVKNRREDLTELLDYLCELEIFGIETYYSKYSEQQTHWLLQEAKRRNLYKTVGSDFHGTPMRRDMMNFEIDGIEETIRYLLSVNRYQN
jgi:predicted metal-dependent phosphoesterase TrpH